MGYGRALLQKDVRSEEASLRKKSKKKGLWGSIGRTIGSLGAMAISGGTLNPVTLGLLSGGASFLGGAIGAKAAGGKLTGGKFFKEERADLQRELGGFGSKNIVEALKGGVTAGIGQATKLYGAGTKAAEAGKTAEEVSAIRKGVSFGESFKESMVGKGLQKAKTARKLAEYTEAGYVDPNLQTGAGDVPIVAMDRRMHTIEGQKELMLQRKAPGLFRQTAEGGAPVLQDESLDAILQRQSASATAGEKAGIKSMYGGGGTGIDPSIQSTGNEFIDRQLGSYVEPKHRLSQAQSGVGRMDRGDMGSIWDKYNIEKVAPTEKMETSLFTKFKGGVRDIGRKFEQGLIEGEQYNTGVPYGEEWGVVPREKDISATPNGGKPIFDWQLGGSGLFRSLTGR